MAAATLSWLRELADTADDATWQEVLAPFVAGPAPPVSLHLAVVVEPYLGFILSGQKTIESRFSVRPMPPYGRVERGDIVLMKQSGGPIVGMFTAGSAWEYRLDAGSWGELRRTFAEALCAQSGFWEQRASAEYATLIRVLEPRQLAPLAIPKRDRRGWVVMIERARPGCVL